MHVIQFHYVWFIINQLKNTANVTHRLESVPKSRHLIIFILSKSMQIKPINNSIDFLTLKENF